MTRNLLFIVVLMLELLFAAAVVILALWIAMDRSGYAPSAHAADSARAILQGEARPEQAICVYKAVQSTASTALDQTVGANPPREGESGEWGGLLALWILASVFAFVIAVGVAILIRHRRGAHAKAPEAMAPQTRIPEDMPEILVGLELREGLDR